MKSDISNLQKGLSTSRSYIITLESDKLDLEHSLRIHEQKLATNSAPKYDDHLQSDTCYNPCNRTHVEQESITTWMLEQRIKQLQYEIVKHDNRVMHLQNKDTQPLQLWKIFANRS